MHLLENEPLSVGLGQRVHQISFLGDRSFFLVAIQNLVPNALHPGQLQHAVLVHPQPDVWIDRNTPVRGKKEL